MPDEIKVTSDSPRAPVNNLDALETALKLTVSWLKKFQDRFDELGDHDYGTYAYGHRQYLERVIKEGK